MSAAELAAEWERVHDSAAPMLPPALLRRGIGYRRQEKAHGGLPAAVTRELARIAAGQAAPEPSPSTAIRPGTRLVRGRNGRTIEVLATEDGFVWEDRPYRSLTSIAFAVTGARWWRPRFFGLTRHG